MKGFWHLMKNIYFNYLKESHGEERNKIKYLVQRLENQERSKKIIEDKMKKVRFLGSFGIFKRWI